MAYETTQAERGSELPLLLALHAAEIGVWEYDVQRQKLTWDARIRQGIEVETDAEPDWNDGILPNVHPDDRPKAIEAFLSLIQAGAGGTLTVECRMIGRRTGQISWVALSAISVPAKDDGLRLIGTARNITAERLASDELRRVNEQLEERVAEVVAERQVFADMFESSDDPAAAVDNDLRFVAMNSAYAKACRRIFSVRLKVGDKLGEALAHMPQMRDAAVGLWTRALQGEIVDVPRSGPDPDGAWYDIKFRPLRDRKERLIGAFQYSRDVTQRVRASERLREAQETLQRAQKMEALGQLTGGVAHDFNNLLQVIGGNLQLLKRQTAGDERAERRIDFALAAVTRGAKLASQLLAFGRRQPLEPRIVNLGRFLHGMDDMLRRAIGAEIEMETVISGGLWNTLVDPGQIENAILNLAINARDAMDGQGRLTVEAGNVVLGDDYARQHAEVAPGQYVMVAVTDTGCGMTPEVMARAFDPFFTTKPEGKGTGLGLSMVYGLVKQSGGHVKIYSEVGQGTTVKLYLRRALEAEAEVAEPPTAPPVSGGTETILVVEDDLEVRETTVALLADLGYRVLKAPDAAAGLAVIESGVTVDLLFTDVVMPGELRSADLAQKAQELIPGLPVLYTSGYTENAIVHGGRLDPGVELLAKPYTREALARKLRQLLAARA
jgi:signal transduction histidine kinase